jgi:drug/metabolite transporter (DMT)-like permease
LLYVLGVGICVKQRIFAARTAVILTMEPVFAALFGYWLAGDRLVAV